MSKTFIVISIVVIIIGFISYFAFFSEKTGSNNSDGSNKKSGSVSEIEGQYLWFDMGGNNRVSPLLLSINPTDGVFTFDLKSKDFAEFYGVGDENKYSIFENTSNGLKLQSDSSILLRYKVVGSDNWIEKEFKKDELIILP